MEPKPLIHPFAEAVARNQPVIVTGADGQLAEAVLETFASRWNVIGLTRKELDVTSGLAARKKLIALKPAAIVNCAADNKVDDAEEQVERALAVNALAVRTLARAAADSGSTLVHYSTDFVFDGDIDRPYTEQDEPRPLGVYGASKMMGEWFARVAPQHYVLRVESLFGSLRRPRGSVDRIITAIESGEEARAFVDRIVSPSYVLDVAEATGQLLASGAPAGLYHCVNHGHCTWYDLAQEVARRAGRAAQVVPITVADAKLPTPRPRFAALSPEKLQHATGFRPPTWQDAIHRCLTARGWTNAPTRETDKSRI
jgi:dTDP-4-dehydrorhamnose reductase